MKLLVICSHYPPTRSPEGSHALFLCEKLAVRGLEVHLLTSELMPGAPAPRGFRVHPIMKSWRWNEMPRILSFFRRNRFETVLLIYIDWIYNRHPMVTFLPTFAKRFCGTRTFVTQFENENGVSQTSNKTTLASRIVRLLMSWIVGPRNCHSSYGTLLRDSDKIIALSDRHLESFERESPKIRFRARVIPAPPIVSVTQDNDLSSSRREGREKLGVRDGEAVIIYFGYVYPTKGLETLISAFAGLASKARLLVVGGTEVRAYLDELRSMARNLKVDERIQWMGFCDDDKASLYLKASDICVLPFNLGVRLNNSSFAVAAAHGLPIVTTRGEVLEEPFIDGKNVSLCAPKNPTAMTAAIERLIEDRELRSRLANGALNLAEKCFSAERVITDTLEVLEGERREIEPTSPARASLLQKEQVSR